MVAKETLRITTQHDTEEATTDAPSTKNFQDEVRQWFTAMSPEERAAALGFEDDSLIVAVLARVAIPSQPSSTAHDHRNDNKRSNPGTISNQEVTPSSFLPQKRTTDKHFCNGNYDWEARIAIEIIEKTWEEIMMVGVPNISGVNKKEFVKNSMKQQGEETNANLSDQATKTSSVSINKKDSNAIENENKEKGLGNVNRISNDLHKNGFVSDAYRIPNEGKDARGKTAFAIAQEAEGLLKTSVPTATESHKSGGDEEEGETNNIIDFGSSPTLGIKGESNNEFASASLVPPKDIAATSTINSSTSAEYTIESGLQYNSHSNNKRRIAEVMDNTRCIFPSASKLANAAITGDHKNSHELLQQKQKKPFITINPSYLQSVTGDELLVAFDEIMAMAFTDSSSDDPCSFILPEEATSASWIDLVRSYATTESTSSKSIPLYILVLCRFQHSLAKSYSERNLAQSDNLIGDSQPLSHKSAAQWLSALMARMAEIERMESTKIKEVLSKLASKFPEIGKSMEGEGEIKDLNLEQYLLLPFTFVAGRLGKESSKSISILNGINLSIEESFQDDKVDSKNEPLDEVSISGSKFERDETGGCVSYDSTALPPSNESQPVNNNITSSSNKKSKKKKKKKKRKGGVGAGVPKVNEKSTEAKTEDKGLFEEKGDIVEKSLGSSSDKKESKENNAVVNDTQAEVEVPVIEDKTPPIPTDCEEKDIVTSNSVAKHPIEQSLDKHFENSNDIDLPRLASSANVVSTQLNPSNEEVAMPKQDGELTGKQKAKEDDHEDKWETVEIRPRGRKKISDKGSSARLGSQHSGNNGSANGQHATNLKKKAPRTKETRAKTKTRKMVREILGGVLDEVEERVRKRRNSSREPAHALRTQTSFVSANSNSSAPVKNGSTAITSHSSNTPQNIGSSLRDILVRGKSNNHNQQSKNTQTTQSSSLSYSDRARSLMTSDLNEDKYNPTRRKNEKPSHGTGSKTTKALKTIRSLPADQNTIPTIASTNSAFTPSVTNVTSRKPGVALSTDSSSTESAEVLKLKNTPLDPAKFASPSPPLPTLLSPGNNNSTSSSVASSLDAPHAGHHGNKSRQSENDVGCHLLDVCERLSSEIAVFMKRREAALTVRRHERGLVLAALEKTLGLIWPGNPSVEMYGSCATNLDLPSSDLDVVVCGLNRPYTEGVPSPSNSSSAASNSPGDASPVEDSKKPEDESPDLGSRQDGSSYTPDQRYSQHQMTQYQMQMMYGHMSLNAERVLRLAMELEHQPWAVHVKAIPTASVPVIKILADPARLQGAVMNGNADWLVQQPISGQSPPPISSHGFPENAEPRPGNQPPSMSHFQSQQSSPLWRGADVVNGLLKVDITFEGPEHGGIGSTKFSRRVIEDFSNETGLSPECTPQVQVLMVLKELLAQRRSNEPFSGGLSSYALLLLVISMIGERSIIREELEKTERQRRVVASGGGNSALRSAPMDSMESNANESQQSPEKCQIKKSAQSKSDDIHSDSTNASIHRNESAAKNTGKSKQPLKAKAWQERPERAEQQKLAKTGTASVSTSSQPKVQGQSSWASIARHKAYPATYSSSTKKQDKSGKDSSEATAESSSATPEIQQLKVSTKPSSFADAVAKGRPMQVTHSNASPKKVSTLKKNEGKKRFDALLDPSSSKVSKSKRETEDTKTTKVQEQKSNIPGSEEAKVPNNVASSASSLSKGPTVIVAENNPNGPLDSSGFPQGFHDVIEVLCSGETTPGKLLMHFLLFYGQHFESQSTAIDYSGTHQRDTGANNGYSVRSSYMLRRNTGSYDPVTGMYTVDPIVVYDPLEGAENNNVARSCFAWSSIRWVFAQSYMTLSSAAEQNASDGSRSRVIPSSGEGPAYGHDESGNVVVDPSSPLLELLLSF